MSLVTRRPQAEADIMEIWEYIAEDSVVEADRWVDKLDERFALWATQPMMGRAQDELSPGIRSLARQTTGPGPAVLRPFSPARAWRPAVVAHLPRTLDLTKYD